MSWLIAGLFGGAFVTNVAVAVLPHEPLVIWYGNQLGVALTAVIATAGTLAACYVDRLLFYRVITRRKLRASEGPLGTMMRGFDRAPFSVLAISGLTPLPFWPFKLLAFASEYPTSRYLAAIALGRLPRYALLAWLGVALPIPGWVVPAACVAVTAWMVGAHYWKGREDEERRDRGSNQ